MGYQVYEDSPGYGIRRYAGYGVAGECDHAGCTEEVYRGLDAKCEDIYTYAYYKNGVEVDEDDDWDDEEESYGEGCGLFYCEAHKYLNCEKEHAEDIPKGDTPRWAWFVLNHHSWEQWRQTQPVWKATYEELAKDYKPTEEDLEELES